jgi:hypothetical protein
MTSATRYAVYWAPELDHPLWAAGSDWLGRDARGASEHAPPRPFTGEPRRYGFHATLKAPMALRDGASDRDLLDLLESVAGRRRSFAMPALEVTQLRGFIALRPVPELSAKHPLSEFADACVSELDALRRSPTERELQRRLESSPLDARERNHLVRWGYPYVFDSWQFHMTLSDSFGSDQLSSAACGRMLSDARQHFAAALSLPLNCSSVCVFVERGSSGPFTLWRRIVLAR